MSTVVFKFKTAIEKRARIRLQPFDKTQGRPVEKKEMLVGSAPRITKLMAFDIKFDALVREGEVKDYAELARLGHVITASQIVMTNSAIRSAVRTANVGKLTMRTIGCSTRLKG